MPKVLGGSIENHRRITRERIFDAFSTLLYERGYDAISLADVAAASGMSRTTMYNYFSDKDSLVVGFAEHETQRYVTELRGTLDAIDNPIDRLRAYIRMQFQYFATHHLPPGPALEVMMSDDAYSRVFAHVSSLEEALRSILEDGIEQGYLPDKDVDMTMRLVAACINTGASGKLDPQNLDSATSNTEDFVLCALGVRLSPEGRPRRLPRR